MIEVRGLTKRYDGKTAVDGLTFGIEPGMVTGFLGPNGAGKTTTMRCILGLDYPDAGTVTVGGRDYHDLENPMREVGALIDAKAVHGGRSAYNHLLCLAQTNNLPKRRVGEVLELVGLSEVAKKRSKGFSLGMSQRLGIAATMLGDPQVLMFDEPVNGLDPEGILWIRNLMKALAALLVVSIGIDAAITAGMAANFNHNPANRAGFDATQTSLIAFSEIGQLIIAVIAALAITAEYSTGMIRTSLTAQPRRGTVYAAKAIVLTSLTLIVSLITSFVAFFVGQALLSGHGVSASLFHSVTVPRNVNVTCPDQGPGGGGHGLPPGCKVVFSGVDVISPSTVLMAIIGCALFVTLVALLAFGIGAIVRHTAGAIAIVIAVLFIIPVLEQALPDNWRWDIMRFLPDAANQVVSVTLGIFSVNPHLWSAWPQLGITALWTAALVAVGAYLFRQRDA